MSGDWQLSMMKEGGEGRGAAGTWSLFSLQGNVIGLRGDDQVATYICGEQQLLQWCLNKHWQINTSRVVGSG